MTAISIDDDLRRRFLAFSSEVTAFSVFDLNGTGQADSYLSTVLRVAGEKTLTELLDAFDRAADQAAGAAGPAAASDRATAMHAEIFSDEKLGPVARNIIKLWYAGVWYQLPSAWTDSFGALENDGTFTASPQAYPNALLWPAVGANPPGAKAPGYASWAQPPIIPPIPGEEPALAVGDAALTSSLLAEVPRPRDPAKQPVVTDSPKENA